MSAGADYAVPPRLTYISPQVGHIPLHVVLALPVLLTALSPSQTAKRAIEAYLAFSALEIGVGLFGLFGDLMSSVRISLANRTRSGQFNEVFDWPVSFTIVE